MEKQQNEIFFETKDLTKKFGDVTAVNHVSMAIRTGEIRGLIGENGSGKSTISSMISAIHTVTGGEMFLYGEARMAGCRDRRQPWQRCLLPVRRQH